MVKSLLIFFFVYSFFSMYIQTRHQHVGKFNTRLPLCYMQQAAHEIIVIKKKNNISMPFFCLFQSKFNANENLVREKKEERNSRKQDKFYNIIQLLHSMKILPLFFIFFLFVSCTKCILITCNNNNHIPLHHNLYSTAE